MPRAAPRHRHVVGEAPALRARHDHRRRLPARRPDVGQRAEERLRLQHHPRPAAERRVVHDAVPVRREVAQVVDREVDDAALVRPGHDALAREAPNHLGEDRDDVDAHDDRPPFPASLARRPPSRHVGGRLSGPSRAAPPARRRRGRVQLEQPRRRIDRDPPRGRVDDPADLVGEGHQHLALRRLDDQHRGSRHALDARDRARPSRPVRPARPPSRPGSPRGPSRRTSPGSSAGRADAAIHNPWPRSASAASTVSTPSNSTSGRSLCQRTSSIRSTVEPSGVRPARAVGNVAPGTKRSSPKSVSGFTTTSPRSPCGRSIGPDQHQVVRRRSPSVSAARPPRRPRAATAVSRNSTCALPPVFSAASDTRPRTACAVRPCRPITRPMSPGRHEQLDDGDAAMLRLGGAHQLGLVGERPADDLDERRQPRRARHGVRPLTTRPARPTAAAGAAGLRATSVFSVFDGWAPFDTQCAKRSRSSWKNSGLRRGS